MAYGTGVIPFIRTSDLSNGEIKCDYQHGVSEEIYNEFKDKIDINSGDILMVRDGTYLIGTTAIVTESDLPMLFQSHLYRIRVEKPEVIDPWLLYICLNSPIVRLQIRAKQFTQDIIDTLGRRIREIDLPIPKDRDIVKQYVEEIRTITETRIKLRNRSQEIMYAIEGEYHPEKKTFD